MTRTLAKKLGRISDLNTDYLTTDILKTQCYCHQQVLQTEGAVSLYSIKSAINVEGKACNNSSKIIQNYSPSYSATVYKKLYDKKHYIKYIVRNDAHCMGTGKNSIIRNLNSVIGGSSSGSALSLKLHTQLEYSICSDSAGSLVSPCVQNSLYGFKPSKGKISRYGLHEYCPQLDRICIMSKTFPKLMEVYSIIYGPDVRDAFTLEYSKHVTCTEFPNKIYTVDYPECQQEHTALTLNLVEANKYLKQLLSKYAFSSLNRYDGVRFNRSNYEAENLDSTIVTNRNKMLPKLCKNRVINGITYIVATPTHTTKTKICLQDVLGISNLDNNLLIIKHNKCKTHKQIVRQEFRYGLANLFNLCSVCIPYTQHTIEIMASAGYQLLLLQHCKKYL